jgi:rhodanese-related sulfurtransferase
MYLWHRANHTHPFLWRFHRMHHSEPQLDATSALRFHPGEILLSGIARLVIVPLLGMSVPQLVVYESVLFPVIVLHHSNVRLPRWLDYGLLALIVTPAMHRVHHSRWRPETDSNYGSVFPYWDRLFRSFRLRDDARHVELGLDEFSDPQWQTVGGLLRTPLESHSIVRGWPERKPFVGGESMLRWLHRAKVLLGARRVTPAELASMLHSETRPVVIDVRSAEAFASGHIPGARHARFEDLSTVTQRLAPETPVVLYCNRGVKSRFAAAELKDAGFDARDLVGGLCAWKGPIESHGAGE